MARNAALERTMSASTLDRGDCGSVYEESSNELERTASRGQAALRLLVARRRAGLSRAEVAKQLSVTVAAVGHWENPKGAKPSASRFLRLARLLGVDVGWLIGGSQRSASRASSVGHAQLEARAGDQARGVEAEPKV
jgi:transcriptional regulator with XRE-family HTH domain